MKNFGFLILAITALFSCDKNNDYDSNLANSSVVDVYVTGKYNNNPCYWKNTQLVLLDNGGLTNGVAQKIMVSGLDVYVLGQGTGYLNTLYWKNGILIDLNSLLNPNNEPFLQINDMFVEGNDVYFCGSIGNYTTKEVCFWKNGVKTTLSHNDNGSANSIVVSNNDIYVTAQSSLGRGYFKNGIFNDETYYCGIYGLSKINNDVYLYGTKDSSLTGSNYQGYYKNLTTDIATYLSNVEYVRNLNGYNNNIYFNDSLNFYTNNNPASFFYNGMGIIDFKIVNNNSYIISIEDSSNVNFYLDINNTNSIQISGADGEFTSILVI